jgi:hypothetical protein
MFEPLHQVANAALGPTLWLVIWSLIKIVAVVLPLMGCVAYLTLWERKAIGWSQIRPGPNRVGPFGLLTPIADAVKGLPTTVELGKVLDTVAEWMTRSWMDERALIFDALSVGLRLESQSFPAARPDSLRGLLAQRFEAASKAGVLTDHQRPHLLADLYLLTCMASLAGWAAESGRPLLDSLKMAGRLFLEGARKR